MDSIVDVLFGICVLNYKKARLSSDAFFLRFCFAKETKIFSEVCSNG